MMTRETNLSRRDFTGVLLGGSLAATGLFPAPAGAQSADAATSLVNAVVADLLRVIGSGRGDAALFREFERIFRDYADVATIAQSVVGPPWRSASAEDRSAFIAAFKSYMARKYGRQFRDFVGAEIVVTGTRPDRNFIEVTSTARLPGRAPYDVRWLVSNWSGRARFFNVSIAGLNLMVTERNAIGAMLESRGGDLGRLAADLRSMG